MTLTLQIPEEYRAQTLWERPIGTISKSMRLCSAQFVPNQAIYPDGGIVRLIIHTRPKDECLATLVLESDIYSFHPQNFEIVNHETFSPGTVLTLIKEVVREKTFALPNALVQLELE